MPCQIRNTTSNATAASSSSTSFGIALVLRPSKNDTSWVTPMNPSNTSKISPKKMATASRIPAMIVTTFARGAGSPIALTSSTATTGAPMVMRLRKPGG